MRLVFPINTRQHAKLTQCGYVSRIYRFGDCFGLVSRTTATVTLARPHMGEKVPFRTVVVGILTILFTRNLMVEFHTPTILTLNILMSKIVKLPPLLI